MLLSDSLCITILGPSFIPIVQADLYSTQEASRMGHSSIDMVILKTMMTVDVKIQQNLVTSMNVSGIRSN
jgi:hypothetical protein